jgi:hypothetical protein
MLVILRLFFDAYDADKVNCLFAALPMMKV